MNSDTSTRGIFSRRSGKARTTAAAAMIGTVLGGFALAAGCANPPVCECDAAITKLPTSDFPRGGTGTFAILVDYFGNPLCKGGRVCIDDVLPAGLTYSSTPSTGWTCSGTTTVHCCYSGNLPSAHAALPLLTLVVDVAKDAPDVVENCATIEQGKRGDFSDAEPGNNKSCTKVEVTTPKDPCPPEALDADLSSGMQDDGAGALSINASDDTWSIVASPGSTAATPAVVLNPNPAWHAAPAGAQWIGPKSGASTGIVGDYTYETCFCMREGFGAPQLDLTMFADNLVTGVALNGCQLLAQPGGNFQTSIAVQSTDAKCFQPGENCIDITVKNLSGPTGLAVTGSVTAKNGLCCAEPQP